MSKSLSESKAEPWGYNREEVTSETLSQAKLEQVIRQAFADTNRPDSEVLVDIGENAESDILRFLGEDAKQDFVKIKDIFAHKTWQELTLEDMPKSRSLVFLTTEAYRYFLPAYMIFAIKNEKQLGSGSHQDILVGHPGYELKTDVVMSLRNIDPASKRTKPTGLYRSKITGFRQEQKKAIISFLKYMSEKESAQTLAAKKALKDVIEVWNDV